MTLEEERDFWKLYCKKFQIFSYLFAFTCAAETAFIWFSVLK